MGSDPERPQAEKRVYEVGDLGRLSESQKCVELRKF